MKYNFDELTERRNTGSYKWDSSEDDNMLPMWVADMDFRTAPEIIEALKKKVEDGIFGYVKVDDSYYNAVIEWFNCNYGWSINKEKIIYTSGVVPAISAIIKALSTPGDGVVVQTPAYNCFFSSVRNNGCRIIENPLKRIETSKGFTYQIDWENLQDVFLKEKPRLLILCNPHNPSGRVWDYGELKKLRDMCRMHNVRVISDEIHCELTYPDYSYIPYATVDEDAVICCSPSKAFNIAGLQIANIIVPTEEVYAKVDRAINDNEVCDVNPFGVIALKTAYNEGGEWLMRLKNYLYENYLFLREEINKRMPMLKICDSESTYLAWIDVSALKKPAYEIEELVKRRSKVWINAGEMYGAEGYIRINYACPRRRLEEGLDRFCRAFGR